MNKRAFLFTLCALGVLGVSRAAHAGFDFEPRFEIGGYLSTQVGIFTSTEKFRDEILDDRVAEHLARRLPTNHGDKLGELSMFRNTLFIEADWAPWEPVSLHGIFRGVRSFGVPADERSAEPPFPGGISNSGDWVRDTYYEETDIRELYLTIEAASWLSFRIGKQQISWGELGQYRLLDVVNPTNTTWHFGPLESFEDTRIPLWMFEALVEIPALAGSLEFIWLPLVWDDPEDRVTTPLTFTGAWGLPLAPGQRNEGTNADRVNDKYFDYPGGDLEDSRLGVRWKGELGQVTYSLAYMYTHQLSPPIPRAYWDSPVTDVNGTLLDVYLDFPRQHIVGGSIEVPIDSPVGIITRLEVAYEPNRTFPGSSVPKPDAVLPGDPDYDRFAKYAPEGAVLNVFSPMEKQVLTYGVQFMRPTMIRALNPTQNFIFVLQFMHTVVLDFDEADDLNSVPGYDTTALEQHGFTVVAVATTSYLNGMLKPVLIGAYLPPGDGFLSAQLRMVFGNHWRLQLSINEFWGENPYDKIGFFRDRDEVNLKISYQF